jgi:hypothetical protein
MKEAEPQQGLGATDARLAQAPIVALVRLMRVQQACTGGLRGLIEFEVIETIRGPATTEAVARFEGLPPDNLPLDPSANSDHFVVAGLMPVKSGRTWSAQCIGAKGDAEYLGGVPVSSHDEGKKLLENYR